MSSLQVDDFFTIGFEDLGNLFKVVIYYFLIRGMTGLGYQDGFPMVSV